MRQQLLNFLIIFLVCSVTSLNGQTLKQYEKKAQKAFSKKEYSEALAYYKILLEIDPNRGDALYYAGESARQMRAFHYAEPLFARMPDSLKTGDYFLTDFYMGDVKKGLKKYSEAIDYYQQFLDNKNGVNELYMRRADEELEYCEWALTHLDGAIPFEVIQYDTSINTYRTDFAPFKVDNSLFYTSAWESEDGDLKPVTKVFCSIDDAKGIPLYENTTEKGKHTSNMTFGREGTRMYYTICEDSEDFANEFLCKIYYRNQTSHGGWSEPQVLSQKVNMSGYSATQPSAIWDEEAGQEILFFASNRPGGAGGFDIWFTHVGNDSTCTQPQPLEEINTEFDDMTPYFHKGSNSLFFSSKGHLTLGGLDIFRTVKVEESWSSPENLGMPINSSYDDLYYTFNSDLAQAHLASNRPEAMCDDPAKGCTCDDIFYYDVEVKLDVLTFNDIDKSALSGVRVELRNLTDNTVETFLINEYGNDFHFPLVLEKDYEIVAAKEGYEGAMVEVSTKGIISSTIFNESLYLRPRIDLVVLTYDAISKEPLNRTAIRLDWMTYPDSSKSVLNSFDTNKCIFPLKFGQEYEITAAKTNYSTAYTSFSTEGYTTPTVITKELYLTPFVGLPLTLYFDNDKPRYVYRSDTTTKLTYAQTYNAYLKRKRTFVYSFSAGLAGSKREIARDTVRNFFTNEVQKGYEDLLKFSDILIDYLKGGNRIEIIVEGYASPLAASDYNKKLTGRRVSSVVNQLRTYKNGALASYIDNKTLIIKEAPKGEEASPEGVEDSPKKRKQSVYSPSASRQRRVKILDIRRQEDILSYTKDVRDK